MPRQEQTKAMTVRLTAEQAEELEAVAHAEGIPVAEVVRRAIDGHVQARLSDEAFQRRLRETIDRNRRVLQRLSRKGGG